MSSSVVVTRLEKYDETGIEKVITESLKQINFTIPESISSIAIKPNLRYYWDYSTGETTDPRLVDALISYIRKKCPWNPKIMVVEADASAMRTKHAFRMLGWEDLAINKNVELVNLSDGKVIEKTVSVADKKVTLPVSQTLLDSDMIINVPKLKLHRLPGITVSLKNMFGAIAKPWKAGYHPDLDRVIVAINKMITVDLTIVDGIIALGKHPIKLGLLISGIDPVAVDAISARTMGCNPKKVSHLTLAAKENLGTIDDIGVLGDVNIEDISRIFPKENHLLQNISWDLQLKMLYTYIKLTGDTLPPVLEKG